MKVQDMIADDASFYWSAAAPWCLIPDPDGQPLAGELRGTMIDCRIPADLREQMACRKIPPMSYGQYLAGPARLEQRQQIRTLALACGFKLKRQPGGELDLNPYVYDFAQALLTRYQKGEVIC